MNYEGSELEKPKFAISLFVFDYQDDKIKVLEIAQKTIIKEVDKISQTEDYQDIHAWDFIISRTGTKMSTEYRVMPAPRKKGFDAKIQETGRMQSKLAMTSSNFSLGAHRLVNPSK